MVLLSKMLQLFSFLLKAIFKLLSKNGDCIHIHIYVYDVYSRIYKKYEWYYSILNTSLQN